MTVSTSKAGQYVVEGTSGNLLTTKLAEYVVEGGDRLLYTSKLGLYVVEGPPPIIPPALRRRQLNMP